MKTKTKMKIVIPVIVVVAVFVLILVFFGKKNNYNGVEQKEKNKETKIHDFKNVSFGEKIELDFAEITIDGFYAGEEILPQKIDEMYSLIEDKEGEKYFWLEGSVKNLSGEKLSIWKTVIEFTFDDKYNYVGDFMACADDDDYFQDFPGIDPLKKTNYYMVVSVPDELANSYSKCDVKFGFKENFTNESWDGLEKCDYLFQVEASR